MDSVFGIALLMTFFVEVITVGSLSFWQGIGVFVVMFIFALMYAEEVNKNG